ncbi:hypothetical protein, partial [Bradyrhizobium guangdongense]|uniref:hypothetical protein n=1 Tax=Bradyrhizobium guangdongense TaxID=1325090 RepID=UPI001AECF7B8
SARQTAAPIPREPPVTSAVRPLSVSDMKAPIDAMEGRIVVRQPLAFNSQGQLLAWSSSPS